MYLKSILRQRP